VVQSSPRRGRKIVAILRICNEKGARKAFWQVARVGDRRENELHVPRNGKKGFCKNERVPPIEFRFATGFAVDCFFFRSACPGAGRSEISARIARQVSGSGVQAGASAGWGTWRKGARLSLRARHNHRPRLWRPRLSRPARLGGRALAPRNPQWSQRLVVGCWWRLVLLPSRDGRATALRVRGFCGRRGLRRSPTSGSLSTAAPRCLLCSTAAASTGSSRERGRRCRGRRPAGWTVDWQGVGRGSRRSHWRRDRRDRRRYCGLEARLLLCARQLLLPLSVGPVRGGRSALVLLSLRG
jgi:hypothetical protein